SFSDMTKKVQFLSKLFIGMLVFACSAQLANGQYNTDSVRALRRVKLERLAKDPGAPLGSGDIAHIHYYEPDSTYRVHARVELLHGEQPFRMPTSDGTSKEYVRYAKARFAINGEAAELTLYRSTDLF